MQLSRRSNNPVIVPQSPINATYSSRGSNSGSMPFYCVKCRKAVTADPKYRITKNNRRLAYAECPNCNHSLTKFVKAS